MTVFSAVEAKEGKGKGKVSEIKKLLLGRVLAANPRVQTWVKCPYVHAHVEVEIGGMTYLGDGFAKWATEDMDHVRYAEHRLEMANKQNKRLWPWQYSRYKGIVKRLGWQPERGKKIAVGRAYQDIVNQLATRAISATSADGCTWWMLPSDGEFLNPDQIPAIASQWTVEAETANGFIDSAASGT